LELLHSEGAIRAVPNATVREVMLGKKRIEFDVEFRTNNIGFIDDRDYTAVSHARRRIAFVGDSFTAGTGAPPWVPRLAKELIIQETGIELFNLGFVGTGFHHFARLVDSFRKEITVDELYVVAICDDFGRPDWVPRYSSDGVHFCKERDNVACLSQPATVRFININDSEAEIERRATSTSRGGGPGAQANVRERSWLQKFTAASALLSALDKARKNRMWETRKTTDLRERMQADIPSLRRLAAFSGPRYFLHIPEKDEVNLGRYLCSPKTTVESLGFVYLPFLNHCPPRRAITTRSIRILILTEPGFRSAA